MESKKVAGTILTLSFRMCLIVLAAVFTILLTRRAYQFGVSIFHEYSMTELTGEEAVYLEITIGEDDSNMDIATLMEQAGLSESRWLFYAQIMLSDHKISSKSDPILPGTYVVSTDMTPTELMEVMSTPEEAEEE